MFENLSLGVFVWMVPVFFVIQCAKKSTPPRTNLSLASIKSKKGKSMNSPMQPPAPIPQFPPLAPAPVAPGAPQQPIAAPEVVEKKSEKKSEKMSEKKSEKKPEKSKEKSKEKTKQKVASEKQKQKALEAKPFDDKMKTAVDEPQGKSGNPESEKTDKVKTEVSEIRIFDPNQEPDPEAKDVYKLEPTQKENVFGPAVHRRSIQTTMEHSANPIFLDINKVVYVGNVDNGDHHGEPIDMYKEMESAVERGVKRHEKEFTKKGSKSKSPPKSEPSEKVGSIRRDENGRLIFDESACKMAETKYGSEGEDDRDDRDE